MDRDRERRREAKENGGKEARMTRVMNWRKDTNERKASGDGEAAPTTPEAMAKAMEIIAAINAEMASTKSGASTSAAAGSPSTAPTSLPEVAEAESTEDDEDKDEPEAPIEKKPEPEPKAMKAFPNIFTMPSKAVDAPSEVKEKDRNPPRPAGNLPPPPIFRPVLPPPVVPMPQRQALVKSASKFNLSKRSPPPSGHTFKKPALPIKVFDTFFGQDFPNLAVSPRKGESSGEKAEKDDDSA